MPDDDQRKVKDLIASGEAPLDAKAQADLERWFGLPSVAELADQGLQAAPFSDEEMAVVIERRERALASVDKTLVAEIILRTEEIPNQIGTPRRTVDVTHDGSFAFFDHTMVDRALVIAEPRTVEIPDALTDALKECTPQALLRDLHRPEQFFDKTFEIIDAAAEQRLDIVAEVRSAMRTSWKLPAFGRAAVADSRDAYNAIRSDRRKPWTEYLPHLQNRTVRE
jgi:hypothetical protein